MQKNIQIFEGKKIGYFISRSSNKDSQEYILNIAMEASENGAKIFLITDSEQLFNKIGKDQEIEIFKLINSYKKFDLKNKILNLYKIFNILKSEKPDIIHSINKHSLFILICAKILNIKNIILTISEYPNTEKNNKIQKNIVNITYFLCILFSHKTILTSENFKKHLSESPIFNLIKNKITIISVGIKNFFTYPKSDSRKVISNLINHKISSHDFLIINWSDYEAKSNQINLINAFENIIDNHKNLKLILAGSGKLKNKIKNIIKNKNLEEKIFVIEELENLREYLKAFDLMIEIQKSESILSNVLCAGYAEIPLIMQNSYANLQIIKNEINVLTVDANNIFDLGQKINLLIKDKKMRDQLSLNLNSHISENFLITHISSKIFTLYNNS